MLQFILEHWVSMLFGLLSTFLIWYCRSLHKKFKNYKALLDEKQKQALEELIDKKLERTQKHFDKLDNYFIAIEESYRFRLLTLCKEHLAKGYLSPAEYSQISEMWKVYHALGGNGQGEDYYHKVEQLPIR